MTTRNTAGMRSVRSAFALCSLTLLAPVIAIAHGRAPDSGIDGRVVPCGIVLERPAPCAAPAKVAGTIVAGSGHQIVRRVKVQSDGSFRVRLAAGSYWLQARNGHSHGPRALATVSEGHWTTVTLVAGQVAPPHTP
jgi:hypothetical protein